MNILVAGASGAIGRPLMAELVRQGHAVTGLTNSDAGARIIADLGASVAQVNVLDAAAVEQAVKNSRPEVVIDELTALPRHPQDMAASAAHNWKVRREGGGNLLHAARAQGVWRYLQQSSGFFLQPGPGLADESAGMAIEASPGVAAHARSYAELESRVLGAAGMEGVALRYGFFYGPGTWYHPDGAAADQARQRELAVIGAGEGVWSWVHIEDAAAATIAALNAPPGIYHIVDDDPSPVSRWLPAFARSVGAPPPPQLTEQEGEERLGADAVYYGTRLRGASNEKAKRQLGFQPRRLPWLQP
ncbi:MAG: NAD(P)-dependent oxidoreductase [Pirellulaceae bacterium]|nr:NAD(P)-dependent oxidoreductase [Pirellulaceae bacterium]